MGQRKHYIKNTAPEQYPHLLNFSQANGPDYLGVLQAGYFVFSGEFYFEIEFEYSALQSSYAALAGKLGGSGDVNGAFRILVSATTTIVNVVSNTNMSYAKATATNTKYKIKVRRDASDIIWISYDDGAETNIGTRSGEMDIDNIAHGDTRYLTGKVYRFNVNGEEFGCNEGSGATVTGSNGTVLPIVTGNAGGQTYIDNTMWQEII